MFGAEEMGRIICLQSPENSATINCPVSLQRAHLYYCMCLILVLTAKMSNLQGDSGGPSFAKLEGTNKAVLLGATSRGSAGCIAPKIGLLGIMVIITGL